MRVLTAGLALIIAACGGVGSAKAQEWQGVEIDPQGLVRPALLQNALQSYQAHAAAGLRANVLAIADFGQPSSARRFYLVDLESGVVTQLLVAHGRGSDQNQDGMAERFSDRSGSLASSLGAYRASEIYVGEHGLALRLDGLDNTNRNARERAIVVHSGWYVSDKMAQNGGVGRSYGCFVVDLLQIDDVVRKLGNGGFIYAGL
jgi:hypothetical protein